MVFRHVSERCLFLCDECDESHRDWLSIPFAIVPRKFASFFDGISLVSINLKFIRMVCILNLNHQPDLAKLKVPGHLENEME